jgi:hypothetical protein
VTAIPNRIAPELGAPRPFRGERTELHKRAYCCICGELHEPGDDVIARKARLGPGGRVIEPFRIACLWCGEVGPKRLERKP